MLPPPPLRLKALLPEERLADELLVWVVEGRAPAFPEDGRVPVEGRAPVLPVEGRVPVEGRDPRVPVEGRVPAEGRDPRLPVEGLFPPDPQPRASRVPGLAPLWRMRFWSGFHDCLPELPRLFIRSETPALFLPRSVLRFLSVLRFTFLLLSMSMSTSPWPQLQ